MTDNPTITLIHTQFGPYHLARAKSLLEKYPGNVQLLQLASKEQEREWKADFQSYPITTVAPGTLQNFSQKWIANKIVRYLKEAQPKIVIIAGYSLLPMRAAANWANHNQAKVILLSDSQSIDKSRNWLKELFKKRWVQKNCHSAFVAGASAYNYLVQLGFERDRIWRGYDVVDNDYFHNFYLDICQDRRGWRQKLQLPESYFLYVGRFSKEKNLKRFLKAYQQYRQQSSQKPCSLVLVGTGEEEESLKETANALNVKGITWAGFKQLDELPIYYSLATALVLPSLSEPWGLVVNEGMACFLPILCSDRCGCMLDLVFPGINGCIFNPYSVQNIANALEQITLKTSKELAEMGQSSQNLIRQYTPETWSKSLIDCIEVTLRTSLST